jgi:branched-chain amino acid transport system ATP-binding protein
MPLLEVETLHARYGYAPVVRGVSFSVDGGEIVSIFGRNGAGKTTTLRAIMGWLRPSQGRITFAGESIAGLSPDRIFRRGVAFIPEDRRIFATLSVEENLVLGLFTRWHSGAEERRRLDLVFDLFPRLRERRRQLGKTLSGGEQQMLAIGRALMSSPKLVLLDEPSLGLAPMLVEEIFGIVRRLVQQEQVSVLLVEQNAAMALEVADQGYVMENGRIVLEGSVASLRDNSDIREFYLGLNEVGSRKSYRDVKHYKRRKRWLS